MKIKRHLTLIFVNLFTFLVLVILVNWGCGLYLKSITTTQRDRLPNYQHDPDHAREIFYDYGRVQHQYEPFVGWRMKPYSGKTLTINAEGERIHEAPDSKKDPVVRFFGGSTMWGEGSDDHHTIPALFNDLNPQFDVYNHAQLAYNSRQELDALISLYSRGEEADIVIFYDGVNDAAFLCPKEITNLPAHRLVPMYREKLYTGKAAVVKDVAHKLFLENILIVIRRVKEQNTPAPSPYNCLDGDKALEIAEIMIRNWEMAHELVTRRGGRFIAILQPAAFVGNPRTDHLSLDNNLGENFRNVYRHIREKITERNHDWIVDLSDRFDGREYIYIDFCHVSPNGNQIIAREISHLVRNTTPNDVTLSALYP